MSDGYLSINRPHYVVVPDEEIAECEDEDSIAELIEEYLQMTFEANILFFYENEKCLVEALQIKQEYKEGD